MNDPYKKHSSDRKNRKTQNQAMAQGRRQERFPVGPGLPGNNEPTSNPELLHTNFGSSGIQSIMQLSNFSHYVDTPTSLTNLAQLSGISVLPVSANHRRRQQLLTPMISGSMSQPATSNDQARVTVSTTGLQRQGQIAQNGILGGSQGTNRQERVFNLEDIPSIQLLNRISVGQNELASHSGLESPGNPHSAVDYHSSSRSFAAINKKSRSQARSSASNTHKSSNRVQVLSASEGMGLMFTPNSVREMQSIERMNPSAQTSGSASPFSTNQGNDNFSLMKLMAIFNNPALTITPVSTTTSPSSQKLTSDNILLDSDCQSISFDQSRARQPSSNVAPSTTSNRMNSDLHPNSGINYIRGEKKAKIPKSATNLLAYGTSTQSEHQIEVNDDLGCRSSANSNERAIGSESNRSLNLTAVKTQDEPNTVTLSWYPSAHTTRDSEPKRPVQSPSETDHEPKCELDKPQEMLTEHVDNSCIIDPDVSESIFVPECILSSPKIDVHQLIPVAKYPKISSTVKSSTSTTKDLSKGPIKTTKRRLYLPRAPCKRFKVPEFEIPDITIDETRQEMILSERHFVLEKFNEIAEEVKQRRHTTNDPDDIFVNKSKRIMSKIDTEIERSRRRRFEKISRRISPKNTESNNQSEDSDDECLGEDDVNLIESTLVPIQLPLEEVVSSEKREYLSNFGLITRYEKNKILITQCEDRMRNFSALAQQDMDGVSREIDAFVDAIIQTGGTDIKLITETDIKRNDLPLIEGLKRSTSRIKMNFMSALGLEKRSKRTILYKVKPTESTNAQLVTPPNNSTEVVRNSGTVCIKQQMVAKPTPMVQPVKQNGNVHYAVGGAALLRKAITMAEASCREAIVKLPNKDEYMKSLGLMAS